MRKIRFYKNQVFDEIMTNQFLDVQGGGIDFGNNILKEHPQLKSVLSHPGKRKKIISDYFDTYYVTHGKEMDRKIDAIKNAWKKKENKYVAITEAYFSGFPFPEGKYIAYASIVNCNPRFLDSKTFQFFYKKPISEGVLTIAHELLHFIFFEFVNHRMKKNISRLSKNQLWDLSEIFNVILLRSSRYRGVIDRIRVGPYPDHRRYVPEFEHAYAHSKNVEEFIKRGINILKKPRREAQLSSRCRKIIFCGLQANRARA